MIPLLEEQNSCRRPFFKTLLAWGGDLALTEGLIGCIATSAVAASGFPATNINDGDKTLLNGSWWESTRVGGKAFGLVSDGKILEENFDDFTNWSVKLTDGFAISDSSTADSPWAKFAVASSSPGSPAYVFRRSNSSYDLSIESIIFAVAIDAPSSRSHSDTNYNETSIIFCPTSVSTTPIGEPDYLRVSLRVKNEGIEIEVSRNASSFFSVLYTSSELTTNKKRSNFRILLSYTSISVWHEELGEILPSTLHLLTPGLSPTYVYLQLENRSGDIREGSIGGFRIFKAASLSSIHQTIQNLASGLKVSLEGTEFQNGNFANSALYSTQEYLEDFEDYALDIEPPEWVMADNGGNSTILVKSVGGSQMLQIANDSAALTWGLFTQRMFYDFEYCANLYIPDAAVYSEDFEAYSIGDPMTNHGWTWHQFGADTGTFNVIAGKSGQVTGSTWAGGYTLDAGAAWTDYTLEFDVPSVTTRMLIGWRHSGGSGYYIQHAPGLELTVKKSNTAHPGGDVLIANWNANDPGVISKVKMVISGNQMALYMDDVLINTLTDNTYTTGTIAVSAYQTTWEVDNIVVTPLVNLNTLTQLIRCADNFSNAYHLHHDILNSTFKLLRGPANVTGGTLLDSIAYTYPLNTKVHVRCLALDDNIKVWIDNIPVCDYTDSVAPIYSGKVGLQIEGNLPLTEYIDDIVIHTQSLPEYWKAYNEDCGLAIQQTNFSMLYPERYTSRTSTGVNNFSWVDISDALSSTENIFFDENHRGGCLCSDTSSNGVTAGSSDTIVQEVNIPFRVARSQAGWLALYHIKDPNSGKYSILVDGNQIGSDVDTYNATNLYKWESLSGHVANLTAGSHTLTIKKLGTKNASSTDYWVRIFALGLFASEDALSTWVALRASESYAFSSGAGYFESSGYSGLLLVANSTYSGKECGIKQEIVFPEDQEVYVRAKVITPTAGVKVTLSDSITGFGEEYTLSSAYTIYTITLRRCMLESAVGDICLYISDLGSNGTAKVYVQSVEVLGKDGLVEVTHLQAPYTTSIVSLTGDAPTFIESNLLLDTESFQSPNWAKCGDLEIEEDAYINPVQGANSGDKILFKNSWSYIYQEVNITYKNNSYELSMWVRADAPTSIYMGILEDISNPNIDHFQKIAVTASWERVTFLVDKDLFTQDTKGESLYIYIGTYGLFLKEDLPSTDVYLWGVSFLENNTNLSYYFPREETNLLEGSSDFPYDPTFLFSTILYSETFESYSSGYDLTLGDWDEINYDAISPTFTVQNGLVGMGQVEALTRCSYRYNDPLALSWMEYDFTFNIISPLVSNQELGINFRWDSSGGYSLVYTASTGDLNLYYSTNVDLITGRVNAGQWLGAVPSSFMGEVKLRVKGPSPHFSTLILTLNSIEIFHYLVPGAYTKYYGSFGFTFINIDDSQQEGIVVDNLKITSLDSTATRPLVTGAQETIKDSYDTGQVLTDRTFTGSIYLKGSLSTPSAEVYVILENSSSSQYILRKVLLTRDWQKILLDKTFTTTSDTKVRLKISITMVGAYPALAGTMLEAINGVIVERENTDHCSIWEGSENLILYSEDLSSIWVDYGPGITKTIDQYTSPISFEQLADKFTTTLPDNGIYQVSLDNPASKTYTFSMWLRADQDTDFTLRLEDTTPTEIYSSSGLVAKTYWQRFSFTATFTGAAEADLRKIIHTVNGGDSLYIWGVQLEEKFYPTKYIKTVAAPVTRNATRLLYTTPANLSGEDSDWSITMKFSLLADAFTANREHVLLTLGAHSTTIDNTAKLYIENNFLKLDFQEDNSRVVSMQIELPADIDLKNEYLIAIVREGYNWTLSIDLSNGTFYSTLGSGTDFIFPSTYCVGCLDDNTIHGNIQVSDIIIWKESLSRVDIFSLVSAFYNYNYSLSNTFNAIIPFLGTTDSLLSGGTITFTLGVAATYPLDVKWGVWEGSQQKLLDTAYSIFGGSIWDYVLDWLMLTFNTEVTFNRLNLFSYPNKDSSLNSPYTAGRGGLGSWILEYWDSTLGEWVLFFRETDSTTDLDILDLTNLCSNGTFEGPMGTTGWEDLSCEGFGLSGEAWSGGTLTDSVLTGLYSLSMVAMTNPPLGTGARYSCIFHPGETYTVSGWYDGTGNIRAEVYDGYEWHYGDGSISSGWTRKFVTFTVNSQAIIGSSFIQFVNCNASASEFSGCLDEVTIIPHTRISITTNKIRLVVHALQEASDVARVVALQVFNFIDESSLIKDNNISLTYKKTPETNLIAPSDFQVTLSNLDGRFTPRNSNSPIYGVTQADGRGFVRAGTPIEISGGFTTEENIDFFSSLLKGTIGNELNPASNTGIEVDSGEQTVTLVGGDHLNQLARTSISDYNIVEDASYEEILTHLCQLGGFAIQEMQFDESGTIVPFSWLGGGQSALTLINKIIRASYGAFFSHPDSTRFLYFYDGIKFKAWLQTTKDDFDAGVLTNVSTTASPGNVQLILNQSDWDFSWGTASRTNLYSFFFYPSFLLYDDTYLIIPSSEYNVKDYHFETSIADNWDTLNLYITRFADFSSLGYIDRCSARSLDGVSSTSMVKLKYLDLGTSPQLYYDILDAQDTIILSGQFNFYNSGNGYEDAVELDNGVIPEPYTVGSLASYTLKFTLTQTVTIGEDIYVYLAAGTTVGNGTWNDIFGVQGVSIDGVDRQCSWVATESAYTKLSCRLGAGANILGPGVHTIKIDKTFINTIHNPAVYGTDYKACIWTSHEQYLWSATYNIGSENGVGPGTYYFARRRRYYDSTTGKTWGGLLQGRSVAFIVPSGQRQIPYVTHHGGGRADTDWESDWLYWVKDPVNPDDALYTLQNYYNFGAPGCGFKVDGAPSGGHFQAYYAPGKASPIPIWGTGWNELQIPLSSIITEEGQIKLRLKFKKSSGSYGHIQTKDLYIPDIISPSFDLIIAHFDDEVLIDSIKGGVIKVPSSGNAVSNSFDTTDSLPIWGEVLALFARSLDSSKNELVTVYSQSSDDDITWYGQAGVGQWDDLGSIGSGSSYQKDILSPKKRYIRFKLELSTGDQWWTPIITSFSFKYIKEGNIVSQVVDVTSQIIKWGLFGAGSSLESGVTALTYETLSADDQAFTLPDPAGWKSTSPGNFIQSEVKRYLKWRANLTTTDGEETPTLHNVTINWEKGLTIPSSLAAYSYDDRLLSFAPSSGNPRCNRAEVAADFYLVDPGIITSSITAFWNGGGSSAKLCGREILNYPTLPLVVDSTIRVIELEATDPTITTNTSVYSSYPRAFVVEIGAVSYGVYGYDSGIQEGVEFTFLAGALKLKFEGLAKRITCTITTTGATSITSFSLYGYSLKQCSALEPPLLTVQRYEDTVSQKLYNHIFLNQISSEYITSEEVANNLAELLVEEGKFVKDYGQVQVPMALSLNLQTKVLIT